MPAAKMGRKTTGDDILKIAVSVETCGQHLTVCGAVVEIDVKVP